MLSVISFKDIYWTLINAEKNDLKSKNNKEGLTQRAKNAEENHLAFRKMVRYQLYSLRPGVFALITG
jgi:hypothetical protein